MSGPGPKSEHLLLSEERRARPPAAGPPGHNRLAEYWTAVEALVAAALEIDRTGLLSDGVDRRIKKAAKSYREARS